MQNTEYFHVYIDSHVTGMAKKNLQFTGPKLSALLEACNRYQTEKKFCFEIVFSIVKIFARSQMLENFHAWTRLSRSMKFGYKQETPAE